MTNDSLGSKGSVCGFGCEVKIYHDSTVKFTDGSSLIIPRESDGSIHYCNILGPDPEAYPGGDEKKWQDWEHWSLEEELDDLSGLEFKIVRDKKRKELISALTAFPDFYNELHLEPRHKLPYCLQTGKRQTTDASDQDHSIHVFEVLGLFYQMDGNLEDAEKCFKLLLETATCHWYGQETKEIRFSNASQKIKEINGEIYNLQEKKKKLEIPVQASQQEAEFTLEGVKIDNRKLRDEIDQFEEEDLHNFILKKFPGRELSEKLQKTCVYKQTTKLSDKVKYSVKEEEENSVLDKQSSALSYLDFGNKITIVSDLVKKPILMMLLSIKRRRNELAHPDDSTEEFKKSRVGEETSLNRKASAEIDIVKRYFVKLLKGIIAAPKSNESNM